MLLSRIPTNKRHRPINLTNRVACVACAAFSHRTYNKILQATPSTVSLVLLSHTGHTTKFCGQTPSTVSLVLLVSLPNSCLTIFRRQPHPPCRLCCLCCFLAPGIQQIFAGNPINRVACVGFSNASVPLENPITTAFVLLVLLVLLAFQRTTNYARTTNFHCVTASARPCPFTTVDTPTVSPRHRQTDAPLHNTFVS
jgi:hypothetical protein